MMMGMQCEEGTSFDGEIVKQNAGMGSMKFSNHSIIRTASSITDKATKAARNFTSTKQLDLGKKKEKRKNAALSTISFPF